LLRAVARVFYALYNVSMTPLPPLSAFLDEEGRVLVVRTLATIQVSPWHHRLLEIAAEIDGVSVRSAIDRNAPADESMVSGTVTDILPVSLWRLVDHEHATDTQVACAAFDCGFRSKIDTPWADVDSVEDLPSSPDAARLALKQWLTSSPPEPTDSLCVTALEHAIATRFGAMGVTIRKILIQCGLDDPATP
jgi:hypothetical protein